MATVASLFPLLAVLALVLVVILAVRLDRRLSRSAYSAGAAEPQRPAPVGLARAPWELGVIEAQLAARGRGAGVASRNDLTATVNRLSAAAGFRPPNHHLPIDADLAEIDAAVAQIEQQLGLPPLGVTETTEP